MNKLFLIFLRTDVTILSVTENYCKLIWTNNKQKFLVQLLDDGRILISALKRASKTLSKKEIDLFAHIFIKKDTSYLVKNGLNTTFISIHDQQIAIKEALSQFYKAFQEKQPKPGSVVIDIRSRMG